jgi:hypothetical protein
MANGIVTGHGKNPMPVPVQIAWVAAAVTLIILRMFWSQLSIDSTTVGLLLVAGVPWLFSVLESAKLPGGIELKLRSMEEKVESQKEHVEQQDRELQRQQDIINQLVVYTMSDYIFWHLCQIFHKQHDGKGDYIFRKNQDFEHDLRFLMDNGYIKYVDVANMADGTDLVKVVELTPVGTFMVQQREQLRAKQAGQ